MIKRLATLQFVLLVGLGSVFILPKDIRVQPSAINPSLPPMIGDWQGRDEEVSAGERAILGPDTQFSRKVYSKGTDEISVSIVLSGPDMNTSIHRPERCLPAQGWTIVNSETIAVPIDPQPLRATRLQNVHSVQLSNGRPFTLRDVCYYWFVGQSDTTPSHYERAWIDIRDRVLKGRNQQWAYVTVTSNITKDFKVFGRDAAQTDALIRDFLKDLVPQLEQRPLKASG
jgi:EpsI family protein